MPENSTLPSVVYDAENRELRTVRDYFAQKGMAVIDIMWQAETAEGSRITAGQLLGHIIWESAPAEPLKAPTGCAGRIERINGQIAFEMLHLRAETLLRLEAG